MINNFGVSQNPICSPAPKTSDKDGSSGEPFSPESAGRGKQHFLFYKYRSYSSRDPKVTHFGRVVPPWGREPHCRKVNRGLPKRQRKRGELTRSCLNSAGLALPELPSVRIYAVG